MFIYIEYNKVANYPPKGTATKAELSKQLIDN